MKKIHPCLWFDHQAEEAARLYTSLFESSKIGRVARYSEAAAKASGQKPGSTMTVEFELGGSKFLGLNGGPQFKFSPAQSLFVWCESEKQVDRLWKALSEGGTVRMGLDEYAWSPKYGWTADRFGVEWQVMLSDQQGIAAAFLFVDSLFGKGEEAVRFYQSVFRNSRTEAMARDEASGAILHCQFTLEGSPLALMEGKGKHGHTFSPAFSLVVECRTQSEIDEYWAKLSHDPSAGQCGWLNDKYGVSWQIVPTILGDLIADPKRADGVMKALLAMKKLDIGKLERA